MAKFNITQGNLSFSINPVFAHTNTKYLAGSMYEDATDWSSRKQNINAVDLDWGLATSWDNISATKPSTISTTADIIKAIKYASTVGGSSNSGTVTSVTIQAGTNISVNNTAAITTSGTRTISHATPIGASSGKKGNNSAPLLASITTDSQGHVTGYTTITAEQLYNLIEPYLQTTNPDKTLESISVSGFGLPTGTMFINKTYIWNRGTVTATYSDDTRKNITNYVLTLSSSNTSVATVDGLTINAVALGSTRITATYTYTENGVTETVTKTLSFTVEEQYVDGVEWSDLDPVSGNVGDDVNFGFIDVIYADGSEETYPYNYLSGVKLYTDAGCTNEYNKNTQYTDQPIWVSYEGFVSSAPKRVTLTPTTNKTLSSISVSGQGLASNTIYVGRTTTWNVGTVTATYSDGTSKTITSNDGEKSFSLISSDTSIATISGITIRGEALGTSEIRATYTYTENGVTRTVTARESLNVISQSPSTTYYYSAGTTEVTTSNYTTANNARSVTSISQIPSSLDISSISRKKVYIVLPEGCTPIAKTSANIAIEFTTQTVNNHVIYTSATNIGSGSTCTISK